MVCNVNLLTPVIMGQAVIVCEETQDTVHRHQNTGFERHWKEVSR